jgi:aminoglycoside phosphotransferase (APT) family kinase protein
VGLIPTELADLDAAWLGAALGAPAERVTVLDSHSGTTGRARLAVRWAAGAPRELPASVFVKFAPFDTEQRGFVAANQMGVREARLYRDLAAELPVRVPRPWHAAFDDDGRYVMVLEDLVAAGCSFPSPKDPRAGDWVGRIVESLARLHARFHASPRFAGDLAWLAERGTGAGDLGAGLVRLALDRTGARLSPAFRRFAALYVERAPAIAARWNAGATTLVHGDPHLGNLFLDGERIGFLDWGVVGVAPGMRDVAYVLCNSVPAELRRAQEQAWLVRYRAALAEGGVALDAGEAFEQYRLFAIYGWLAATATLAMGSKWQPESLALSSTERATLALEDLGCEALVRES